MGSHPKNEQGTVPSRIRVVSTAGHVDHGKSALIEALTGTHPDRLKEEQDRQMTIDLGFGYLRLPDGQEVGIVDVPGHSDFIENMVAGVNGIDAVLLVIAGDEGIRPQTLEHLAIVDLLRVRSGVIALTKSDLVTGTSPWERLEADVRRVVRNTVLDGAPMVRVSARSGSGLQELLAKLSEQLALLSERPDLGRPRLAIDRVFSMEGFGTIVTGTLIDGRLSVGEEVELQPSGLRGRVRGLQHHNRSVDLAVPGTRTAVNLTGLQATELRRGDVLTKPSQFKASRRLDAQLSILPASDSPVEHGREVKMFVGTTESMARIRLLGGENLEPGATGLVQLEPEHAVVCARGDAFVLRWPSPPKTLGGGIIIDNNPAGRHKRFRASVLRSLELKAAGSSEEILYELVQATGAPTVHELFAQARMPEEAASQALQQLENGGRIVLLAGTSDASPRDSIAMTADEWQRRQDRALDLARDFHTRLPLRPGIPREELRSQLQVDGRLFGHVLAKLERSGLIVARGHTLALPEHKIQFEADQQPAIDAVLERFAKNPRTPPSVKECKDAIGDEAFAALRDLGTLVQVADEVVFRDEDYDRAVADIRNAIESRGRISLAEVRDLLQTSRKYAQALLEHMDAIGMTRREGDLRVLLH